MKDRKIGLIVLLGINFLTRFLIIIRPLEYIDRLLIPDDAYYAFTIARNIADGLGPLYTLDYTNGFQPLYVFLITPIFWIFSGDIIMPVHASLFILAIFDTLSLYFIYRLISSYCKSAIVPVLIAVSWIFNPYVIRTTLNGLETIISFFFIVAAIYHYRVRFQKKPANGSPYSKAFLMGTILGIAMLARIDNAFLALTVVLLYILKSIRNGISKNIIAGNVSIMAFGGFLAYLPWLIYSYYFTGDLFQISGAALRYVHLSNIGHNPAFLDLYGFMFAMGVLAFGRHNIVYLAFIAILLTTYVFLKKRISIGDIFNRCPILDILIAFSALLFSAYVFYMFGPWYLKRYLFPLILPSILVIALLIELHNIKILNRKSRLIFNAGLLIIIIVANIFQPQFLSLYNSTDTRSSGYMNIGIWARDHFDEGTKIGSSQTGALGYFARNLTVFNLDGAVNKNCYESLIKKENMKYIRDNNIEYVIGWLINIRFIERESKNFRPDDLIPMGKIEGFTSWYHPWYLYKVKYR